MKVDDKESLAWLEVDLKKLHKNILAIRKKVGADRKIMAVVKANAYGHGMEEIATYLLANGVDEMAVANVSEGMTLRSAGIQAPILVLGVSLPEHAHLFAAHHLTAAVCDLALVRAFNELGEQKKQKMKVHIRVDLGLGSIGLLPHECVAFVEEVKQFRWIEVEGIFTQLASSYNDDMNEIRKDLDIFEKILTDLKGRGISIPVVHIASSPAILTLPETYFDLVRPGIIIYGLPALKHYHEGQFQPVMELKAKVVNVKKLEPGTLIGGYGNRYTVDKKAVIATVAIGYGDGLFLFYLKNGEVIIRGKRAPVIGRPFMDYLMIDVTQIENVNIGDEVVIFGKQGSEMISIEEVAERTNIGMMNCDCVTLLNSRIPRIYVSN